MHRMDGVYMTDLVTKWMIYSLTFEVESHEAHVIRSLQPNSDGLQPSCDGLQVAMASNLEATWDLAT